MFIYRRIREIFIKESLKKSLKKSTEEKFNKGLYILYSNVTKLILVPYEAHEKFYKNTLDKMSLEELNTIKHFIGRTTWIKSNYSLLLEALKCSMHQSRVSPKKQKIIKNLYKKIENKKFYEDNKIQIWIACMVTVPVIIPLFKFIHQ